MSQTKRVVKIETSTGTHYTDHPEANPRDIMWRQVDMGVLSAEIVAMTPEQYQSIPATAQASDFFQKVTSI